MTVEAEIREFPDVAVRRPVAFLRERRWVPVSLDVLCGLVALAAGLLAFLHERRRFGAPLNVSSDIIGFPTFHDFNGEQYIQTFYLGVLGGPLVALVVFVALRWAINVVIPGARPEPRPFFPTDRAKPETLDRRETSYAVPVKALHAAALVVGPGAVLGVELGIEAGAASTGFWLRVVAACAVYAVAVLALAVVLAGIGRRVPFLTRLAPSFRTRVALVNSFGACLPVVGLVAVSHITSVTSADGAVHHYGWFRAPLAVFLGLAAAGVVAFMLWWRRADPANVLAVETRAVALISLPMLIFVTTAALYPTGSTFDVFEQGQQVATVSFVQHGIVPYRDFISGHGLFEDTIKLLLGALTVENTLWGMQSGDHLIVIPLCYLSLFYFAYRVSGSVLYTLFIAALFFHTRAIYVSDRFLFWPFLLILLWFTLQQRSRWAPAALGFLTVAFTIVTPEAALCALSIGVALVLADAYRAEYSRGRRLRSFRSTGIFVAACALATAVTLVIFAALGAVGGFVLFVRDTTADIWLTGALPLQPMVRPYSTWAILPVAMILLSFLILAVKVRARVVLGTIDFVMIATTIMSIVYYQKFTNRPDGHVLHEYAIAIPLFIVVGYQGLQLGQYVVEQAMRLVRRDWSPWGVASVFTGGALVVGIVTAPIGLSHHIDAAPSQYRYAAAQVAEDPRLGWFQPLTQAPDVGSFLAKYVRPGDPIFDFTNDPGLLHYVLDYAPAARFYSIGAAYRLTGQQSVIDDLARTRPRLIAFSGNAPGGLMVWDDISNPVRHYLLSQWLLDHYRPFAEVSSFVFYIENSDSAGVLTDPFAGLRLTQPTTVDELYFRGPTCAWGYAPIFLNVSPSGGPGVELATAQSGTTYFLTPPSGHRWSDYRWIELRTNAAHFAEDSFTLSDAPTTPGLNRTVTFQTLAGAPTVYRFPIGACAQWHGYGSTALTLSHTADSTISSVRLLP